VRVAAALALGAAAAACGAGAPTAPPPRAAPLPVRAVRVVAVHPHDPAAYTQGLLCHAGRLYESLGLAGRSAVREVEIATGRVLREEKLPPREFGEGLALVGETLVQLTWRDGVAHRWRVADFAPLGDLRYQGEGWGLAFDGERLIQSDGSATLALRSPADFALAGTLAVTRDGRPAAYLNELEWARGALYANLWQSDEIVRIELATGRVTAVWSAAGLLDDAARARADVLNGIAWNPESGRFYLTGKLWPQLFEVELPD
jgi:glutamine cyclotransferase